MIPLAAYGGRSVGVLGLGKSGLSAARALRAAGATVLCWDDGEAARESAAGEFGIADLTRSSETASLDLLVVSPGVPHLHPEPHKAVRTAWESGVSVDNDISLFFQAVTNAGGRDADGRDADGRDADGEAPRIVCVTGSNGKSTTTALIRHLLTEAGRKTQMGGNIGRGVLDLDEPGPDEVIVLELSSYQIELARVLAPDVAVFLNLSPDHLDRHGGIGGYFAAKRRLFEHGGPERAVIGVDGPEGRFLANAVGPEAVQVAVGRKPRGARRSVFAKEGVLTEWRDGRRVFAVDMRGCPALVGDHNHQNACAAYAAARAVGAPPDRLEAGLSGFPGLAHRLERLAEIDGVAFVNDSKATNADAAEKALLSFDRIRWILGGRAKEGGIAALIPLFDRIEKAYLIGECAGEFAKTLDAVPHEICGDLATATARARAEAVPGETILLAPAAASWDQFPDFEARGETFRALVEGVREGPA